MAVLSRYAQVRSYPHRFHPCQVASSHVSLHPSNVIRFQPVLQTTKHGRLRLFVEVAPARGKNRESDAEWDVHMEPLVVRLTWCSHPVGITSFRLPARAEGSTQAEQSEQSEPSLVLVHIEAKRQTFNLRERDLTRLQPRTWPAAPQWCNGLAALTQNHHLHPSFSKVGAHSA